MLFKFLLLLLIVAIIYRYLRQRRQQEQFYFLNHYRFPSGIRRRLAFKYPDLNDEQWLKVESAMRQYFRLHAKGKTSLAMPSRIVDDFWHEFILHTAVYQEFCQKALGRFIHHTPASEQQQGSNDLQRTWVRACRDEKLNPALTALPLLFMIDATLAIPNGFTHTGAQFAAAYSSASSSDSSSISSCTSDDTSCSSDSNDSSCSSSCGGGSD